MAKRNPGIDRLAERVLLCRETDVALITAYAKDGVDHAFIGPEAPLEAGIVDSLEGGGVSCIGPTRAAARLETDKAFCRGLMERERSMGVRSTASLRVKAEAIAFMRDHPEGTLP